jgi:hypothetical protein
MSDHEVMSTFMPSVGTAPAPIPECPPGRSRLADALESASYLLSVVCIAAGGLAGGPWLVGLGLLGIALFVGTAAWTSGPDADAPAKRIVADLPPARRSIEREDEPAPAHRDALTGGIPNWISGPQRDSPASTETDQLVERVGADFRAQLDLQGRRQLLWACFFFVLGIPVAIAIQVWF